MQQLHISLDEEQIQHLITRTEGWIAGLQMIAPAYPDQDAESTDPLIAAVLSAAVEAYGNSENVHYKIIKIRPMGKRRSSWRIVEVGNDEEISD